MIASTATPAADRQGIAPPPRARILAAARELFYRRGIHAVGVDAIAEAAGTNKMTLYRHFASKDVLIAACLRELQQDFDVAWDASAAAHVGDPKGQLLAWLRHVCDFKANEAERGCALANAAVELPDPGTIRRGASFAQYKTDIPRAAYLPVPRCQARRSRASRRRSFPDMRRRSRHRPKRWNRRAVCAARWNARGVGQRTRPSR